MGTSPDVDESLTLEQIEDRQWGSPPTDATRLVKTVYELRHKPLGAMDTKTSASCCSSRRASTYWSPSH